MRLNEYASTKQCRGNYKVPRSAQKSIPIDEIYEDGIWRSGDVYSMMWSVSDINYNMLSQERKLYIQQLYGALYAGIPSDCWAKFTIVSQKMDARAFRRDVMLPRTGSPRDVYVDDYNDVVLQRVKDVANVIQRKYFILYTNKRSLKEARDRLHHVQGHLISSLSALGCAVYVVNNHNRLQILHNFFRVGDEANFRFDFDRYKRLGHDFRDYVCPDCIEFKADHIIIDEHYARAMSIVDYPQKLDDRALTHLLQQAPYVVLSFDVIPVETEDANRELASERMKVNSEKYRFGQKTVENNDLFSNIPYRIQAQEEIVNVYQTDLAENDQQMFLTLLTLVHFANTMDELESQTLSFKTAAANLNCHIIGMKQQQENCFNTAMPYGLRRIKNVRTMVTNNVAAVMPFDAQDVMEPGGICYGVNSLTGNLIVGSRIKLVNGNAVVIATSGGGKSMFIKLEKIALTLRYPKARFFIIDPENEYKEMVRNMGGIVIDLAVGSNTHFNPLDYIPEKGSGLTPSGAKAEYVLTLVEKLMKGGVSPGDLSLVNRSLKNIYQPYVKSHYTSPCPTLQDLWQNLNLQKEPRARDIALALEVFTQGDLNLFAQPTDVDMSNRMICFNTQGLGEQLKTVAMLSMLEYINTSIMTNDKNDPTAATWVDFDEMYLLLKDQLSADFLFKSWKRFRKYNAYATGITQNVSDVANNTTGYAMLANSEFVVMLRQSENDIVKVKQLYNLSDAQANYLLSASSGEGIIKMGNSLIPFNNFYPHNRTYQMITTKPGEKPEENK